MDARTADDLHFLIAGEPELNRFVYRSAVSGKWFVTEGGGEWPEAAVAELVRRRVLRPCAPSMRLIKKAVG